MALPYITAKGPQPEQLGEKPSALAKLGFAGAGIGALGFVPTNNGRIWDHYLKGIRGAETAFPGAVLRTFRISEFLSPLETWNNLSVNSETFSLGGRYSDFLRNTFGSSIEDISLQRTGDVFGEISSSGQTLGMGIRIKAGTQKGSAIADYFARITGTELGAHESLNEALLKAEYRASQPLIPYGKWVEALEPHARRKDLILGAKFRDSFRFLGQEIMLSEKMKRIVARTEITGQLLRAKAASTAGRLNTLLTKPFEFLPESIQRAPIIRTMAVKPGTALEMAGRYAKKAIVAGAIYKGLEYYDYQRSKGGVWSTALGTTGGAAIGGLLFKGVGQRFSPVGLAAGAAVGLYTALAPRFNEGLFHGAASFVTDLNVGRAKISQATGLTESLQEQERVTPGLVSVKTALGFGGVGALGAGLFQYGSLVKEGIGTRISKGGMLSDIFETAREVRAEKFGGKIWGSKLGKKIAKTSLGKVLSSKVKSPVALGFIGGLAAWGGLSAVSGLLSGNIGASVPGLNLLGTTDTPEELQEIYSGEKEVAIRKGRWWEFGRSSGYEGGRIEYYRPHFIQRLKTRSYQKGLWDSEEERWEHDPMLHPLKALFGDDEWKYHYETKHQYDRPAPLTGTYGEDVPFFGPLVASTVGKMVKPRKLVRPEEWMYGDGEYKHLPDIRGETEPAYELGGLRPGAPVSPDDGSQLFNELMYRRREAVGLVGFAEGAIENAATGREELFQNLQTMGVMGKEKGSEYWLWSHLNIGGGLGTSEPVRRFIPHTRSYLETYNPLANNMPSWIPNDYFLDLKHGNPFDKIPEAEIRLPGAGYAALHPELQGISPEDYPLAHRVKILGDVAMWSKEYQNTLSKAKKNLHLMSDRDRSIIRTTEEQVRSKKERRKITEYRFRPELLEEQDVTVTEVLDPRRIKTAEFGDTVIELQGFGAINKMEEAMSFARDNLEGKKVSLRVPAMQSRKFDVGQNYSRMKAVAMLGDTDYGKALAENKLAESKELRDEFEQLRFTPREQLAGSMTESILHRIETPIEMLTPASPASKLIRQRSAIEEYIATEAIGTGNAFWDRPLENFIKPTANMVAYQMGSDEIPEEIQKRREINEYFDMLAWVKSEKAEREAREIGNYEIIEREQAKQQRTLFGLDVFGSPVNAMKALPRRERDFFASFSEAPTPEERSSIFSLIPENEQRLYMASWLRQEEGAARAKKEAGIATKQDEQMLSIAQTMRRSEGFGVTEDLESQWMDETAGEIPYDEWIREKKAEEYFSTHSLPGADWLGWHPSVDLDDVKLKYVETLALDHHDFDLWGARKRSLARKPYIDSALVAQMGMQSDFDDVMKTRLNAATIGKIHGGGNARINVTQIAAPLDERYDIEIVDGREDLVKEAHKRLGAK